MALNFNMIDRDAVTAAINPDAFTQEFKDEWGEAWEALKSRPGKALVVEFKDAETRDQWFKNAVKYGKTQRVNVRMSKGSDSTNPEHGRLTFYMEDQNATEERKAEAARKAERNLILNAHGHTPKRGKKTADDVLVEDNILTKHYALPAEKQNEIVEAFINAE